jgi:hypothetical protein
VISLRDDTPDSVAEEIIRLEGMRPRLNDVVEVLWLEVEDLRAELARARGVDPATVRATFNKPPTQEAPTPTGNPDTDARHIGAVVDLLNAASETLWYEAQWLRCQLESVLEDRAGSLDDSATWRPRA